MAWPKPGLLFLLPYHSSIEHSSSTQHTRAHRPNQLPPPSLHLSPSRIIITIIPLTPSPTPHSTSLDSHSSCPWPSALALASLLPLSLPAASAGPLNSVPHTNHLDPPVLHCLLLFFSLSGSSKPTLLPPPTPTTHVFRSSILLLHFLSRMV